MRTSKLLLNSSSLTAIVLASAAGGLLAPTAVFAQTNDSATNVPAPPAPKKDTSGSKKASKKSAAPVILVTAQRAALESALQMKRRSNTISDSIVLDEAGKVPSTSLMEILERVPGVTMNRIRAGAQGSPDGYTFEGSGIQVRGLTGTKTLLNGREIFSANGGAGLNYSDIGPELLKAVTVYKAGRADLIAGGIGSTVDLRTYMPFDFKGTHVAGSLSGSYGDFSKSLTPSASMRASTRFHTPLGEFGVLVDLAYSKIKDYDSNVLIQPYFKSIYQGNTVYAPGGYSETDDQFSRVRKGLYVALQWRPADNLQFYNTDFISKWNSQRSSQIQITSQPAIGVADGGIFNDGIFQAGNLINATSPSTGIPLGSTANYTPSYSKTADYSTGFDWTPGRWEFSGSFQYTTADSGFQKHGIGVSTQPGNYIQQIEMNLLGSTPYIQFSNQLSTDPAQTATSSLNWLTSQSSGHETAGQLDASYDLGDGFFKKIQVGGRIAKRKESDNFVGTWWSATGRGWNGVPHPTIASAPQGDWHLEQFNNFFKGVITPPGPVYVPNNSALQEDQFTRIMDTYAACGPTLWYQCSNPSASTYLYGNPPDPNFGNQPSFVTTRPETKAAYVMVGFSHNSSKPLLNFSGNFGVRYVDYSVTSEGNFVFSGGSTYYKSLADAQQSLAMMGGVANVQNYLATHNNNAPLSYTSIASSSQRTGSFSKDYFLPSFNIKFQPSNSLILRYALTETLTPPYYNDIRAQGNASASTLQNPYSSNLPGILNGYSYTSGDPSLQPQLSLNNDLSLEWYPHTGSTLHLALFTKSIKHTILFNYFSGQASQFFVGGDQPQSQPVDGGSPTFIDAPVIGKGNINAMATTTIKGAELGGRTYFYFLPGMLQGFGIDANVTYIDDHSPDALALDMNGDPLNVPLIGLSKWAYSVTVLYDWHKVSARLAWNWRSRYLATTSDASTTSTYTDPINGNTISYGLPVYAKASGRLDASIGYQFNKHLSARLNVANLTNTYQRTEMEILPGKYVGRGTFVSDRRISFNVSFNF